MKKVFTLLVFFLLLIPNLASAHAELESSQPQEGETVKQTIDTLTLQFGEDVEKFTSFTITNEKGEFIPVDNPNISGKTVLVMTDKPLPNGDYTVKWELVAVDGHDNTGQLTFHVGQVEENKAQSNQPAKTNTSDDSGTTKQPADHQNLYISILVILVVILALGAITVFRKRKR